MCGSTTPSEKSWRMLHDFRGPKSNSAFGLTLPVFPELAIRPDKTLTLWANQYFPWSTPAPSFQDGIDA